MTGRKTTPPPAMQTDQVRLHVAVWKIANSLGVKLDPNEPDHVLLERLAEATVTRKEN